MPRHYGVRDREGAGIVLLCLSTEADNRRGSLREFVFPCVAVIAVSHVGIPRPRLRPGPLQVSVVWRTRAQGLGKLTTFLSKRR